MPPSTEMVSVEIPKLRVKTVCEYLEVWHVACEGMAVLMQQRSGKQECVQGL